MEMGEEEEEESVNVRYFHPLLPRLSPKANSLKIQTSPGLNGVEQVSQYYTDFYLSLFFSGA